MKKTLHKTILKTALFLSLMFSLGALGQVTVFSENMGTGSGTSSIASNTFQNSGTHTYSGTADVRSTTPSSGYSGASGGKNVFFTGNGTADFEIAGINTLGYTSLTLSFGHLKSTTAASTELAITTSTDGLSYSPLPYTRASGTGTANNYALVTISSGIPATSNLRIRFTQTSSSVQFRLDDVKITGIPSPAVTTTAASSVTTTGATLNGTINPNGLTTNASFEYGLTTSYGNTVSSTTGLTGSSAIPVSGVVSGLSVNTQYNFRAVGTANSTAYNGGNLTFYTLANQPGVPAVSNPSINSLTVTIDGTTENGNPSETLYAIRETGSGNYVHADGSLGAVEWLATGSYVIAGLNSNTSYTFEVKAKNGDNVETGFGASASGTTLENTSPFLTVRQALDGFGEVCTSNTAVGSFSFDGENLDGSDLVVTGPVGYTFSLTENGIYASSINIAAGNTVSDQVVWVAFSPSLVQSYDGNIKISGGGLASAFQVAATGSGVNNAVVVTTGSASGVSSVSATLGGSILEGCSAISAYGIEYSTISGFADGTGTQAAANNLLAGSFSSTVATLAANTTYYFKAYATDNTGTVYGSQASFTTSGLAAPNSNEADSVTYNSFVANWDAVEGATSYAIDVKTDPFNPPVVIKPWINEFHYDDNGADANEFVEVVVPDSYTGTGLTLSLYNGSNNQVYDTVNLSEMTLGLNAAGYNVYSITFPMDGLQNGAPDGLALSDSDGLIQFLSYEGTMTGSGGPASGVTSTDVGVSESNSAEGASLHLIGTGSSYADFSWAVSAALNSNTKGNVNTGQTINAAPPAGVFIIDNLNVGNVTSYEVTGLAENTDYYYRVRAVSANSTSANSEVIHVKTLLRASTWGSIAGPGAVCDGSAATFNLTGLLPEMTAAVTFNINGGADVTVNVTADATGNGSFDYPLALANNGQTLTVTSVDRTDLPGNPLAVAGNNTVVLIVNANQTFYLDADNDGFGDPANSTISCNGAPEGYVADNTDCDDANVAVHATYPYYVDGDGDGFGSGDAVEVCAVDPLVAPAGYSTNSNDCDDTNNAVHPGATEIGYNLIDDNCDGSVDEGFPPKVTVVQSALCNTTLPSLDSQITANLVAGAQGYRWRVTTMSGPNASQEQIIDTQLRVVKLTQLTNYAFDTQYKIEVAVRFAGFWQPYTASNCIVTTPSATTALKNCGQTLTLLSDPIYANLVPFASGYRFRITDPVNPANTQTIDRTLRDIRLSLVTDFSVQYGKTYNVEVAVRNTDGTYLPYGPVCTVTTPVFPSTSLIDSQCDTFTVPNNLTQLYAFSYPGAIAYVFEFTGSGLTQPVEITRSLRAITLSDVPDLAPGSTYNVRVRLVFNFDDPVGTFGKTCMIVTPGLSRHSGAVATGFDVNAYPNPFAESFRLDIVSAESQEVNVKVYDMTGRLLENQTLKASAIESFDAGAGYPSGVYNVVVTQGDNMKTLRLIKR